MALPCPSCRQPLGLSLQFIIKNPVSACPYCQTIFNFDVGSDIKRKFTDTIKQIDKIKSRYKNIANFK
jgi:hypothetical protein